MTSQIQLKGIRHARSPRRRWPSQVWDAFHTGSVSSKKAISECRDASYLHGHLRHPLHKRLNRGLRQVCGRIVTGEASSTTYCFTRRDFRVVGIRRTRLHPNGDICPPHTRGNSFSSAQQYARSRGATAMYCLPYRCAALQSRTTFFSPEVRGTVRSPYAGRQCVPAISRPDFFNLRNGLLVIEGGLA